MAGGYFLGYNKALQFFHRWRSPYRKTAVTLFHQDLELNPVEMRGGRKSRNVPIRVLVGFKEAITSRS